MGFIIKDGVLKKYTEEPGLTEVAVPEGVTKIESWAFGYCKSPTRITVPEGVTEIGYMAFLRCTGLAQVTLPESLKSIGNDAFWGCNSLVQINVAENNPKYCSIDGALYTKGGKTLLLCPKRKSSITLPEGLTSIGENAFVSCENLRTIKLHPDDPEIFRNYGNVKDLIGCMRTALEMLSSGDYSVEFDHTVKYPILFLHYLHTKDKALGAYIRKNITRLMKAAISNDDLPFIQAVTQDTFITKKIIDRFIRQALDEKHQRAWAYLADYKNRHFGFAPKDDGLL